MPTAVDAPAVNAPRGFARRVLGAFGLLFAAALVVLFFEEDFIESTTQAQHKRAFAARAEDSHLFQHDPLNASLAEMAQSSGVYAPEPWMRQETDLVGEVPVEDRLHLSLLQDACLDNREAIVPWTYGKPGPSQQNESANAEELITWDDKELLAKLRQCPDVDIFLPEGIRGHGYCEDAIAYAKYLKSRLLPMWAIEAQPFDAQLNRTVTYHELCPKTPILLFNHYWHNIPYDESFPKDKQVYFMPNIEMYELREHHLWRVDVVICKTHACYDRVTKWYAQEGNPRNTKVFYTRHTSSDIANFARLHLGDEAIAPKDYKNVRFIHTAGGSVHKGTWQVLDCWLSRPDFPPLDLLMDKGNYDYNYKTQYDALINASQNINLTAHNLDAIAFGKKIAEASFFLCTSRMEGYGHYINQARASGGVILTTNVSPMNELITNFLGVIVKTERGKDSKMFLGGSFKGKYGLRRVDGMVAQVTSVDICKAVEQVLHEMSVEERGEIAVKARQQYHIDTKYFARRMLQLRQYSAAHAASPTSVEPVPAIANLRREDGDGSSA